ncbi:MAG: CHC2 zinc finger domain-containing protein [Acidobacteriota bacterium]
MPFDVVEIKKRTSIAEVFAEHGVALARAGRELLGRCPFHQDDRPSLNVSESKQLWVCFGCGKKGDVVSLVMELLDLPFVAALELLARRANAPATTADFGRSPIQIATRAVTRPPGVVELWRRCVGVTRDRGIVEWLHSRGLDAKLVEAHDLARTVPPGRRLPEWLPRAWVRNGYRLVLPVFDGEGTLTTVRVRSVFRRADPKTRAVLGHTQGRAVMADRLGAWMLSGDERARAIVERVGVYVAEGEPDFLTLATLTPARGWVPRVRGDGHPAVLGIFQTAWCDAIAQRIPAQAIVTIWPHVDPPGRQGVGAGDRYAYEVRESLRRGGFDVGYIRWVELTTATDVNELHLMALRRGRSPDVLTMPMPSIRSAA